MNSPSMLTGLTAAATTRGFRAISTDPGCTSKRMGVAITREALERLSAWSAHDRLCAKRAVRPHG